MIAQVNVVLQIEGDWVVIQLADGSWELPGGTLEPGEHFMEAARREVREEVGGQLVTFEFIGGWRCVSLAANPYRAHLPHPEFYRIVGLGTIEPGGPPANPATGELVSRVVRTSSTGAIDRLRRSGRDDLAQLYELAARIRQDRSILDQC
jgi:8-oxo-dGTP pyrophosphatase MutT (NUDIX family)